MNTAILALVAGAASCHVLPKGQVWRDEGGLALRPESRPSILSFGQGGGRRKASPCIVLQQEVSSVRGAVCSFLLMGLLACVGEPRLPEASGWAAVELGDAPVRGPEDAWVTIVEFADFQCPYCRASAPVVRALGEAYPQDLRVAYRHFLLPPSRHPDALPAALAAECARRQGRFWEMADLLMESDLHEAAIQEAARMIPGLDRSRWEECRASEDARARVQEDQDLARRHGVEVTPTFVVNGAVYRGYMSLETMTRIVGNAIATAQASGIPRSDYYHRVVLGESDGHRGE